jgi:hypothetical protein
MIDISSAAQGPLPTVLCGATQQTLPYPGSANRFDPLIFHGNTTDFDVNEAEKQLLALIKLPETIDGCTLVLKQCNKRESCYRKRNWDFIHSHGLIMPTVKDSDFGPDRVGKLHVSIQHAKHTKSKGTVVKGKYEYLFFSPIIYVNAFIKEKLFIHMLFSEPAACDGQHSYQVQSVNSSFFDI